MYTKAQHGGKPALLGELNADNHFLGVRCHEGEGERHEMRWEG